MSNTDPANIAQFAPKADRTTHRATPGSYVSAFHPYASIARAVLDDALEGWGGNIEASRDPWDLSTDSPFLTVAELRKRCAPLIQALNCARAA